MLVSRMETFEPVPEHEYRFHFKSGRSSLDFAATVGERWRRCFERLRSPEDLARWFVEAEMLDHEPEVTEKLLAQARTLREAIYRTAKLAGQGEPAGADLRELNRWAARTPLAPVLSARRQVGWTADEPAAAALGTLARDAIDLVSGPLAGRVRECARDDCALLFVDTSRPGRRRWCSMGGCGNKTKTAAYRRRRSASKG
jgi:predicted RNA-binding Zn ribbon-like protein